METRELEVTLRLEVGPQGVRVVGEEIQVDDVKRLERQIQLMEMAAQEIRAREEEVRAIQKRMDEIIKEMELLRIQISSGFPEEEGFCETDLY